MPIELARAISLHDILESIGVAKAALGIARDAEVVVAEARTLKAALMRPSKPTSSGAPDPAIAMFGTPLELKGGVFLSYRRDDFPSPPDDVVERIVETIADTVPDHFRAVHEDASQELKARPRSVVDEFLDDLDRDQSLDIARRSLFVDARTIAPGEDFPSKLNHLLSRTTVFVPLIGPAWNPVRDGGKARLQEDDDWVRLEIEEALRRRTPVLPLLVCGGKPPKAADLPGRLRPLASIQASNWEDATSRELFLKRVRDLVVERSLLMRKEHLRAIRTDRATVIAGDGERYVGQCKEILAQEGGWFSLPLPDGEGTSEGRDATIRARWKLGHPLVGSMDYVDGDRYEGNFREGKHDGLGSYTFKDGRRYVGQFASDDKHGLGVSQVDDGYWFAGLYRDDERFTGTLSRNGLVRQIYSRGQVFDIPPVPAPVLEECMPQPQFDPIREILTSLTESDEGMRDLVRWRLNQATGENPGA